MKTRRFPRNALLLILVFIAVLPSLANEPTKKGEVLHLTVHGRSLENNTLGFSVDREVNVYLPPSYTSETERRYPVIYILHGITDPLTAWTVPWSDDEVDYGTIQNL